MAAVSLRDQAIRLLARREHTRSELLHKLLAKGAPADEVALLLEALIAQGYLSDARYAQVAVAKHSAAYGRHRIAQTLRSKGVARADIDSALAAAGVDDAVALQTLWQRRFGRAPVDAREKARQVRFLQARGFALAAILRLLSEATRSPQA